MTEERASLASRIYSREGGNFLYHYVTAVETVHDLLLLVVYVRNVPACIRWYGKRS